MRKKVYIYELIQKKTKQGKDMWQAKTDIGTMGIFDKEVADKLVEGMVNDVEIEKDKDFINIVAWNGAYEGEEKEEEETEADKHDVERSKNIEKAIKRKTASMALSYAKDLAVAGLIKKEEITETTKGFMNLLEELSK
jgi:hypothetical protein